MKESRSPYSSVNELVDVYTAIRLKSTTPVLWPEDEAEQEIALGAIRRSIEETGFVHLRGILPQERVQQAEAVVRRYLIERGLIDATTGKMRRREGELLSGYEPITQHVDFRALVESEGLYKLTADILNVKATRTLDTKWVRIMGVGEATDLHSDFYRFEKLGLPLLTVWIPLMRQGMTEGTLALCGESHKLDFKGRDEDPEAELPASLGSILPDSVWYSNTFEVGDAVLFDIRLVHASFRNDSTNFRVSCDTRWLPI